MFNMFTNLFPTMQPKQRGGHGWVSPMTTKHNKYLITTPEAMALTGWSTATLQRRVKAGLIHSHPDPRDKRRVLWDHAELTSVAFPQPQTRNHRDYAIEDLAMVKFADLLADYVDKPRDEFLESVRNTPVSLLPGILEMALYLAHNTIEDGVAHATPEQVEAAREALADETMTTLPGDHLKSGLDSRVRALHTAGMSQGGIAREMGVSRWQVRKAGERLGLSWDTTITEVAVRASAEHARRDRDRLAQRYLDLSHDFLDQVEESTADINPSHAWEALKSAATSTDKLVALHALTARYPANDDDDGMQAAMQKFDEFIQASRVSAGLDKPGDH